MSIEWRPEVVAFANLMEQQLQANDHKPGWKGDSPGPLWRRMMQEAQELAQEALGRDPYEIEKAQVAKEAADVANFAMMIADVCGALPESLRLAGQDRGEGTLEAIDDAFIAGWTACQNDEGFYAAKEKALTIARQALSNQPPPVSDVRDKDDHLGLGRESSLRAGFYEDDME